MFSHVLRRESWLATNPMPTSPTIATTATAIVICGP